MSADVITIERAPWCEDGDGHAEASGRGDQSCWGPADYTNLTLEEIAQDSFGSVASQLGVMAYRGFNQLPAAYLHLHLIHHELGDLDRAVYLTAAEARTLATVLLAVADTIEGPDVCPN